MHWTYCVIMTVADPLIPNIHWTISNHWGGTQRHYSDVIMSAMASQITEVLMVCSAVCSGADQRKHQSSASPVLVRGFLRWPVNSPHKRVSKAENVSIWWRHHGHCITYYAISIAHHSKKFHDRHCWLLWSPEKVMLWDTSHINGYL